MASLSACPYSHLAPDFIPAQEQDPYLHIKDISLIKSILSDADTFVPTNALTAVSPLSPASLRVLLSYGFSLPEIMASAQGQKHRTARKATVPFFTPAKIRQQEPWVRDTVQKELERLTSYPGYFDLSTHILQTVSIQTMWRILGIDQGTCESLGLSQEKLIQYSLDSLELFWGWPNGERQLELSHSAGEFHQKLRGLVEINIKQQGNIAHALDQANFTPEQVTSFMYFVSIAGQYTTSLLMNTVFYQALNGQQMQSLQKDSLRALPLYADQEKAQELVHQTLAYHSSVPTWRRKASKDAQLEGMNIEQGTEILLELSGHHLSRQEEMNSHQMAFGWGIHRCLGAQLAEAEAIWVLTEVASWAEKNKTELSVASEPEWLNLLSYRAPLNVFVDIQGRRKQG